jgi:transcriptional regulator with XRE-family HTH domain
MFTALQYFHKTIRIRVMKSKEEFTKQLAKKLREIREKKGISQEELADKAKLYRTYVGHIENGRYSPSAYVLYKLLHVLQAHADELFDI